MKLIFLQQTDGADVAINPEKVHKILSSKDDPNITLIRFGRDDFIEVKGHLDDVAMQLEFVR